MLSEFDLIARFFARPQETAGQVALGIGDDCALLRPTTGTQLAISTDMLVESRHFFADADPFDLGHKCLAVNLSDLAAMGARPVAFTLALSLPDANPEWLAPFAQGMFALADANRCALIGGDTTKGPRTISITVFGEVAPHASLRRDAARVGDDIWVSGNLGDARLTLAALRKEIDLSEEDLAQSAPRMHRPAPRNALGQALAGVAHAAIDVSDGLAGDIKHVLQRSQCGARLNVDALPVGGALAKQVQALRRAFALTGGDDYELCFTAAPAQRERILAAAAAAATPVTRVGTIESDPGLRLVDEHGALYTLDGASFDHFLAP